MVKTEVLPKDCPPLTTYYLYLTAGCNLACRHCWISPTFQNTGQTGGHLDYDLYVRAVEEGIPLGLQSIKFTGGEPLLHPDFISMVDLATQKNLRTWMETNGTLLTRETAVYLKQNTSMYFISVSLDGATTKTHEQMRNVPGSFAKAQQGISYLVEAGYKPQVIFSLYDGNAHELESLIYWADANGCGSVKINLVNNLGRGEQLKSKGELLTLERLIETGRQVTSKIQPNVSIKVIYSWPPAMWRLSELLNHEIATCNIHSILGILPGGQISMCGIGVLDSELIYGQVGVDKIYDVWTKHPMLLNIRETIPLKMQGVCSRCIHLDTCLGLCPALTYYETRDLTQSLWFCEGAMQRGLFPASRLRK